MNASHTALSTDTRVYTVHFHSPDRREDVDVKARYTVPVGSRNSWHPVDLHGTVIALLEDHAAGCEDWEDDILPALRAIEDGGVYTTPDGYAAVWITRKRPAVYLWQYVTTDTDGQHAAASGCVEGNPAHTVWSGDPTAIPAIEAAVREADAKPGYAFPAALPNGDELRVIREGA